MTIKKITIDNRRRLKFDNYAVALRGQEWKSGAEVRYADIPDTDGRSIGDITKNINGYQFRYFEDRGKSIINDEEWHEFLSVINGKYYPKMEEAINSIGRCFGVLNAVEENLS